MKQLAVHSLGWSISIIAFAQLPVLANNQAPRVSAPQAPSFLDSVLESTAQSPPLLAVALSSRSLRLGDNGTDVRALQRYLSRNGLYPFVIDGSYGQSTADAVSTYQRIRNLPATGIADEATLTDMDFDFLPAAAAPPPPATPNNTTRDVALTSGGELAPDSVGSDVIALQQRLNELGIPVFVDGVYGFETQQAVRTYQRVQGLNVSGIADSDTLEAMGFSETSYPYVAAVIADESELANVQKYFENAYMDRDRRGRFINIGSFAERYPAEARVNAAIARGFSTRVLFQR